MASYVRRPSLVQAGRAPASAESSAPLQHRHHQHHEYEHRHTRHHMHKPNSHGDDATGGNMDAPKNQLFPQDIIDENDGNDDDSSDDSGSNDNNNNDDDVDEDGTLNDLRRRVTEVVQTVSVVQVINSDGSVLELSTASSPQVTTIQPSDTAVSLTSDVASASGASSTTAASPASVLSSLSPSSSSAAAAASNSLSSALTVAASATSFTNSTTSWTSVSSLAGLSSPLTTGSSAATLLPNTSNSTLALHFTTNGTATHRSLFGNSTSTSTRTSSYLSSSLLYSSSTTFSSSLITSSSSAIASSSAAVVVASAATGEVGSAATGTADSTTVIAPTASSADTSSDTTSGPSTSVLVGGVVGGVAGLALLLLAALMFLKWKRRMQHHGHKLLGDGATGATAGATRGLIEGGEGAGSAGVSGGNGGDNGGDNGGGDGSGSLSGTGSGGVMAERRTTFLMPFSSFASKRQSRGTGGESSDGESGFYRVSGKKLPSVLMYGGDGYRDPRESVQSGSSVVFRDSQGFFGGEGGPSTLPTSRYAVGSPMRPESGVPVFQPGPGKTAMAMRVPLPGRGSSVYDNNDDLSPNELVPPTRFDPIGRSLSSQDGSRGSGSRFTEEIL